MERGTRRRREAPTATVARVTAVLDTFLDADGADLGVTEVAAQIGLAKSVVHRLATALSERKYLLQDPDTRRYTLGPRAVRLGLIALGHMDVRERARPYLRDLARETGETATLSLTEGDQRIYAEQVESTQTVRQTIQLGLRAPLYVGASGKAILAFLPAGRRTRIVHAAVASGTRHQDGTPLDERHLLDELKAIAARGYAISRSERILGAASAAAPVFDGHGNVIACISVASVTVRHDAKDLARFGKLARECAYRLSAELGWPGVGGDGRRRATAIT